MSKIKKCENCGNENIEIINRYKGYYLCGKCGRDTERLYEIEHDAEIRAKAIDETIEKIKNWLEEINGLSIIDIREIDEIAEQLKKEGAV